MGKSQGNALGSLETLRKPSSTNSRRDKEVKKHAAESTHQSVRESVSGTGRDGEVQNYKSSKKESDRLLFII